MLVVELLESSPLEGARLVQTCVACPTQYDVHLADGRQLYFRYRFGKWQLHLGGPGGPGVSGRLDDDRPGGELDGWLSLGEVLDVLEEAVPYLLFERLHLP